MLPESASAASPPRPELSIVVPAFNEAGAIAALFAAYREFEAQQDIAAELVIVDDGSTDGTRDAASVERDALPDPAARERVRLLRSSQNRGKGFALRTGVLAARGAQILTCDADLSARFDQVSRLAARLDEGADIAIGSRDLPDSTLDPPQPVVRRFAASAFRALRRRVLLPRIRDTQCGFKLFTADAANEVYSRCREDGWLTDCEALAIADALGFSISEVAIRWRAAAVSRVRVLPTALTALPTLLRIRGRWRPRRASSR